MIYIYVEYLEREIFMSIFDSGIDNIFLHSVYYKKSDDYTINRIENKKDEIFKYYDCLNLNKISYDEMLDYAFCKYILEINSTSQTIVEIKNHLIPIISKFSSNAIDKFICDNYLKISMLKKKEIEKTILIQTVIKEISIRKIVIDENKLVDNYSLEIFDNKSFFSIYKKTFWRKFSQKKFIEKLLKYRYINLLNFFKSNNTLFKENKNHDKVVNSIIEYTLGDTDICRKENNCKQLIYFLEYVKSYRVEEIKSCYKKIQKEEEKYIQENGVRIERKVDFTDIYNNLENTFKNSKLSAVQKLSLIFLTHKKNKAIMAIENISNIQPSITDILMGNRAHSYYRPFIKMSLEQIYIRHEMNLFLNYYLKYVGYEEFTNILTSYLYDIYEYIMFENNSRNYYEQYARNIIITIRRNEDRINESKKYDLYVNSFYLTSFLEKVLRELYIKSCLLKNEFVETYTLKDIFEDKRNEPLKIILGKNLFMWLKYYLFHDEQIIDGVVIKEGLDIRNNLAHGIYDISQDFSEYYTILLFLTINVILAIENNMLTYPSSKTEQILKKIISKSNINKFNNNEKESE